MTPELEAVAGHFAVDGKFTTAEPFGGGHINDSFLVTYRQEGRSTRFLLQRINDAVFPTPASMMDNIQRVTSHIAQRLKSLRIADVNRKVLTLVQTNEEKPYYRDDTRAYWRLYEFIEGTQVHQTVGTPDQAEQAGRVFGVFQCLLADLPGSRLHETIPGFHDTPSRFEALERAVQADSHDRTAEARR
jgi:hypothetical protein